MESPFLYYPYFSKWIGTNADESFSYSEGSLLIDGSDGTDTVSIPFKYEDCELFINSEGITYLFLPAYGFTILFGVERLLFADQTVELTTPQPYNVILDPFTNNNAWSTGASNDLLLFNGGSAFIDGGLGIDALSVQWKREQIEFFTDSAGVSYFKAPAYQFAYTFGIEKIALADGDILISEPTSIDSYIIGTQGNDQLTGTSSDDNFIFLAGSDLFIGGDGYDTVSAPWKRGEVNYYVNADGTSFLTTPGYGRIDLDGIEKIALADSDLIISNQPTPYPLGFASRLSVQMGTEKDDQIIYSQGACLIDGQEGYDEVFVGLDPNSWDFYTDSTGLSILVNYQGEVVLRNIERVTFLNGNSIDVPLSSTQYIYDPGLPYWEGTNADDFLVYNGALSIINGLRGEDCLSVRWKSKDVSLTVDDAGIAYFKAPAYQFAVVFDVEKVAFADGQDISIANASSKESYIIDAALPEHNDSYIGTEESDRFLFLTGKDFYDGLGGFDSISIPFRRSEIVYYIDQVTNLLIVKTPGYGELTILNIEQLCLADGSIVFGSLANDVLNGGVGNDLLIGEAGNDVLYSKDGNDVVIAGIGNDLIIGGSGGGDDIYDGGDDIDTVKYTSATLDIAVNLTTGFASGIEIGNDTLSNIENVIGGQSNDLIVGTTASNTLDGFTGDDTINGGGGNDTLIGGDGNDTAVFSNASTSYIFGWDGNTILISDSTGTTRLSTIENLQFSDRTGAVNAYQQLNLGQATFSITGASVPNSPAVGNTLTANTSTNDLDGNGTFIYTWQTSLNGTEWSRVGNNLPSYSVAATDEGAQIRLLVAYTDLHGFIESVTTSAGLVTTPTTVTLAVSPTSVTEDGTANLVYTFTRTGLTTNALTINYTVGGSATLGTDYTGISATGTTKTISFAAGSATATVTIDPTADTTIESNETVALTLATGMGYTIGTTTAVTGTITNDDISSSTSRTLIGAESSLLLTGNKSINGTGNGLDNSITGNSNNNTLGGALGNDILTGGLGADIFRFDSVINASTSVDRITDFTISQKDKIQLENTGAGLFTAIAKTGTLASSAFISGTDFTTTIQRILYDGTTGNLFYDADGSASGSAPILFATLSTGLAMTNTQFVVT